MPDPLDLPTPPPERDPAVALAESVRHWLAQPGEEMAALLDVSNAVDVTLLLAWENGTGTAPERFAVAVQAAGELLDALGLALAEGQ
jgi:hypothetical protein